MHASQLLATKYDALEKFTQQLLSSKVSDQIAKIVLFGSVARGDAHQDSDVDVLIFGFGDLRKLLEVCAEISLDIVTESGELIQSLVYSIGDLSPPGSYFIHRVMLYGKEIFSMDDEELRNREMEDCLSLAREYLESAEIDLADSRYRTAVDMAYNAAESCVRGLLLLKLPELPRSHGGLLNRFSELYVKNGPLPRKIGSDLNIMLKLRSIARYDAHGLIEERNAQDAVKLAKALMEALESQIRQQAEQN